MAKLCSTCLARVHRLEVPVSCKEKQFASLGGCKIPSGYNGVCMQPFSAGQIFRAIKCVQLDQAPRGLMRCTQKTSVQAKLNGSSVWACLAYRAGVGDTCQLQTRRGELCVQKKQIKGIYKRISASLCQWMHCLWKIAEEAVEKYGLDLVVELLWGDTKTGPAIETLVKASLVCTASFSD